MAGRLIGVDGPVSGQSWEIGLSGVTIGRDMNSTVNLADDMMVERQHARVFERAGQFVIADLGSLYGTQVNGQPIAGEYMLNMGDQVKVGSATFRFEGTSAAAATGNPYEQPPSTGTVYAPPGQGNPYAQGPGYGPSPYPRGAMAWDPNVVPPELQGGWNWGAFWFSWIWGLNHRAYITLISLGVSILSFIPYVGSFLSFASLGLAIWFGLKGNTWAWQSGRFQTVEDCKACQRIWAYWVLGAFLVTIVCVGVAFALVGAAMFASGGARPS